MPVAISIFFFSMGCSGAPVTFTITVNPGGTLSSNAGLSALKLSTGTLSPAFATGTTSYTASVSNTTTSITTTPTTSDPTATVKVNGTVVASGAASGAIALNVGTNTITTVVTAQNGATTKTYTVTVTRAPSNDAYLSSLTVKTATLSPAFAFKTLAYTSSVPNATSSVTVTPALLDATASVKVNGTAVANKAASGAIALAVGSNTIDIVVTAQDGVTIRTYKVTVTRAMSGMNSVYNPGNGEETPTVSSLNQSVEANNILSPNGDGINDVWVVKNIALYPDNTVTVYNKAGQVVFTKKGYANDWDGAYRGSVVTEGTYYYLIDLGNGNSVKGFITVVNH